MNHKFFPPSNFLTTRDPDLLGFGGIVRREARHRVGAAIGDPDPILLIHGEVEGPLNLERAIHGFAVHGAAQDAAFRGIALRQINDLVLFIVERVHVAIRRGDDALHRTQLSAEVVAGFGGKRFPGLAIEDGDGLADRVFPASTSSGRSAIDLTYRDGGMPWSRSCPVGARAAPSVTTAMPIQL
jgi:hypothetical protein